jgi:hypothetical protein
MSRGEVEVILGPPNLTDATLDNLDVDFEPGPSGQPREERLRDPEGDEYWLGNAGAIMVNFENDRAVCKVWGPPRAGPLTRLRRWWDRWFP